MNCEDAKNTLLLQAFGKLTPEQKAEWDAHLKDCPRCARMSRKLSSYHDMIHDQDDIPLPDWEKSWDIISCRAFDRARSNRNVLPTLRWTAAAAALLAVFVLGFLLGRRILNPTSPLLSSRSLRVTTQTPLERYADTIEALLTGFVNRSDINQPAEFLSIEKQMIEDMLIQTRLLKGLARDRRMPHLDALLEDLEFILLNLSHLQPEDRETARYLNRLIREKSLRFQLKDLASRELGI